MNINQVIDFVLIVERVFMSRIWFLTFNVLFTLSFFCLALYEEIPAQVKDSIPTSGKELFIQYRCVRCHTIGRGRFVGPDLEGVNKKYSKNEIQKWLENPQEIYKSKGKMPLNEGYPPMPPLNVPPKGSRIDCSVPSHSKNLSFIKRRRCDKRKSSE